MLNADLIIGVVSLVIAVTAWVPTRGLTLLGGVFVDYTLIVLASLGVVMVIKGIVKPEKLRFFESMVERNNILIGLGMLVVYLVFMPKVGFLPASYLMYAAFNWYLSEDRMRTRNIIVSVLVSLVVVTGFYLAFRNVLGVPLPKGSWFD
jgi:hypothetical protein